MFPLGTVLFPHALLPLYVFELRYRALTRDCLAGDRRFGVVLIERGPEVGGGDSRFEVGTEAHILEAHPLEDGRWILLVAGRRRLRVRRWLPDDPYPRAEVEAAGEPPPDPEADERREAVQALLGRVAALSTELGTPTVPVGVRLHPDPVRASYQAATLASPGPLDAQRLLEAEEAAQRLGLVAELLSERIELLGRLLEGP